MHITTHTSNAIVVFSKKQQWARATQHARRQRNRIFEDQQDKNYLNSSVEKVAHRNRTHFKTINTPHKIWSITTSLLYALTNPRISSNRNATHKKKYIYFFLKKKYLFPNMVSPMTSWLYYAVCVFSTEDFKYIIFLFNFGYFIT